MSTTAANALCAVPSPGPFTPSVLPARPHPVRAGPRPRKGPIDLGGEAGPAPSPSLAGAASGLQGEVGAALRLQLQQHGEDADAAHEAQDHPCNPGQAHFPRAADPPRHGAPRLRQEQLGAVRPGTRRAAARPEG